MSGIFRLRYYLRRAGEKQPLLLLQPVGVGGCSDFAFFNTEITALRNWYLYAADGACEAVQLNKLQALNKSQDAQRQLLRELRQIHQGRDPVKRPVLSGELSGLWQASIKGIAWRQLEAGQFIASEGVWLVNERSFYVLLPCSTAHGRYLQGLRNEQRVELEERTLSDGESRRIGGFLAIVEQFSLNTLDTLDAVDSGPFQQVLLGRLSLDRRSLIAMNQPPQNKRDEAGRSLYGLRFIAGNEKDLGPFSSRESELDIFLFAPVSSVDSSFVLRRFLLTQLPLSCGKQGSIDSPKNLCGGLEDLAASFVGWGASHKSRYPSHSAAPADWQQVGAWRLKRELFQKYGHYILQRARQFGGYAVNALADELNGLLPSALFKSLLTYLCGSRKLDMETVDEVFWASCQKVDGYLLAEQAMFPALRRSRPEAEAAAARPEYISPQGRKLLEDLTAAGDRGISCSHLYREQGHVLQALLRSGWALQPAGSSSCVAASCYNGDNVSTAWRQGPICAQTGREPAGDETLASILARYKRKNGLRQRRPQNGNPRNENLRIENPNSRDWTGDWTGNWTGNQAPKPGNFRRNDRQVCHRAAKRAGHQGYSEDSKLRDNQRANRQPDRQKLEPGDRPKSNYAEHRKAQQDRGRRRSDGRRQGTRPDCFAERGRKSFSGSERGAGERRDRGGHRKQEGGLGRSRNRKEQKGRHGIRAKRGSAERD